MKYYFNASSEYCNRTLHSYVYNLTSSYIDQGNESTMVATSIIMFILATVFFNLNLFSHFSDVSAFLKPSIRLFLTFSLTLFLPVMSYLFSEAKNVGSATNETGELSLRARTILMWMLLVELLWKKVEKMILSTQAYSGTVACAARISWLGYLVFFNLRSTGKNAFYGILWVVAATKLGQRIVILELGKRSFAHGKNPQIVASYMAQTIQQQQQDQVTTNNGRSAGLELLKECRYAVMGEENLERKARSGGYHLLELTNSTVVTTVGDIWKLDSQLLQKNPELKRLSLSFALHKILRRRLEELPITADEARNCHDLIFEGLCGGGGGGTEREDDSAVAVVLFQVLHDEVQFLCEYYHSTHPVVFASPFFLLTNYVMFPVAVCALCILMIILCSNGDVLYAFRSFQSDYTVVSVGIMRMTGCLIDEVTRSPPYLFSIVNLSTTTLLLLTFAYEQVGELVVFLLSNRFVVSLLCSYALRRPRYSFIIGRAIRSILWVRNMLSHPNVCFKQFSVLWRCRTSPFLPNEAVPLQAKKAITERLLRDDDGVAFPVLSSADELYSWACGSDDDDDLVKELSWAPLPGKDNDDHPDLAEVILTWHIATELLEAGFPLTGTKTTPPRPERKVAVALSRYCAYLVAFHPELLPDEKDATGRVYRELKGEVKKELGCYGYYLCRECKVKETSPSMATTVLGRGSRLGKVLVHKCRTGTTTNDEAASERVWRLLAELWTEVVVYAAPTGSEQHVKAHKEALARGGEFITLLWALATHTGISRRPAVATTAPRRLPQTARVQSDPSSSSIDHV